MLCCLLGSCKEYYEDPWIYGKEDNTTIEESDVADEEEGSGSGSGSGAGEPEEMSKEELQSLFGKQRCKPEPVEPCVNSTFGCCPDGFNSAEGPFNAGCDEVKTCEDTKYGCCRDGASLASGMKVILPDLSFSSYYYVSNFV